MNGYDVHPRAITADPEKLTQQYDQKIGQPPAEAHRHIRAIYDYWLSKHDGDLIPDRTDLDPVLEIPRLLANVWLLDVEQNPRRYRFRLAGSQLTSAVEHPVIGSYLDEHPQAANLADTMAALDQVCASQTPYWRKGKPVITFDRFLPTVEFLLLPLRLKRSTDTRMMMNLSIYHWKNASGA